MDSFNKLVGKLGEEPETPQPESRELSKLTAATMGGPSQSRLANITTATAVSRKVTKEVRLIGDNSVLVDSLGFKWG